MKSYIVFLLLVGLTIHANAQIGIGTVSPNSTLDVRGSFSSAYRSFTISTSASSTDHTLAFTGTSASSVTLPDATTCAGRIYLIKNASTTGPTPLLTINTTSSQTIDGITTYLLDQSYESVILVSNGAGWHVAAQTTSAGSGNPWIQGGNNVSSLQSFGTTSNFDLPFITNNTEKMRLSATGNLGIGTSAFNVTYPEKLIVDAGTTSSVNAIVGKGNINNYLQLNIQNNNAGTNASSDVVATADNGNETTNYVDMGINSSVNSSGIMGSVNDAYLYNIGQNFLLGTGTASKSLVFMTGGTTQSANERMRIDGSGNVGIGLSNPAYKLHVSAASNPLYLSGVQTGANTDSILTIINGVVRKLSPSALTVSSSNAWSLVGNTNTLASSYFLGTTNTDPLIIKINSSQTGRFDQNSIAFGAGSSTSNSTNSYAFGSAANVGFNHTNAFAIGNSSALNSDNSFAIGNSAVVNGSNSFAIGNNAAANNANSVAIGSSAVTAYSISDAIAIGSNATANSSNSIAIGSNGTLSNKTQTNAASAIAIGNTSSANSANAIVVGTSATTGYNLTNPISIGVSSIVNGSNGVSLGNSATISFVSNATALGAFASISNVGNNSTALGSNTSVTGSNSTAVGYNTSVTQNNALILGDRSNTNLAVGIGTESFSFTNREKLLVDAGTTSSVNTIVGKGNINNYLQLNIQNINAGTNASSDVVATADDGTETNNYVDMGINSSVNSSGVMGAAHDAYLYNIGQNFLIGAGAASKSLIFMTGGTTQSTNERMRIDGSGNVGIGTNNPLYKLHVSAASNPLYLAGVQTGLSTDSVLTIINGVVRKVSSSALSGNFWALGGNSVPSLQTFGTTSNFDLPFITNNIENMRLSTTGYLGIGTNAPTANLHVVNSGTATNNIAQFLTPGLTTTNATYLKLGKSLSNGDQADIVYNWTGANNAANYLGFSFYGKPIYMALTNAGNLGVGTTSFNATNPEKLVVDAGVTSSVNAIVGKGNINNYLQLNIQNNNAGTSASSDVVATADNGSETTNYVDMGINSSINSSGIMGAANDAYLYNIGQNFLLGTGTAAKSMVFMTGGTTQATNERMRIDGSGNVGIGTNNPGNKLEVNSGTGGASGLRLKQLPSGAVLFMSSTADVAQNNNNFYFDATNYRLSVAAGTSPASTLQVGGSIGVGITTKTANYTASVNDHTILCNNTSGAITISLPTATGCTGRIYVIKKTSAAGNNVIVAGYNAVETIDGSITNTITTQYNSIMIQSDGSNWFILSKN